MALVSAATWKDELETGATSIDGLNHCEDQGQSPQNQTLESSTKRRRGHDDTPNSNKRQRTNTKTLDNQCCSDREITAKPDTEPCTDKQASHDRARTPTAYWVLEGHQVATDLGPEEPEDDMNVLERLRARTRSTSRSRKRSQPGGAPLIAPSEDSSAPYRDARYEFILEELGIFMKDSSRGITQECYELCQTLLTEKQPLPQDSLFRDDLFATTCQNLQTRNETRVIRDIGTLIVPSAETLTTYGAKELACLIETVNESWANSIPLTSTKPQPDYGVGFKKTAFTADQLKKLKPFIGDVYNESHFVATYFLYFPFLTAEVKCGREGLDVADRQNAHSAGIAARAVTKLFKAVGREKELDRNILAWSVSFDTESVRIYGHYPDSEDWISELEDPGIYRRQIRKYNFTDLEGTHKWVSNMFTQNVLKKWRAKHYKRICSAIDQLPLDWSSRSSQSQLAKSDASGLSQVFDEQSLTDSFSENAPPSQDLGQMTPDSTQRPTPKRTKGSGGSQAEG